MTPSKETPKPPMTSPSTRERVEENADKLLLFYIQNWGQSNHKKTNTLTEVAQEMGFTVKTIENEDGTCGWDVDDSQSNEFTAFVEDVRNVVRSSWEAEREQLMNIIQTHSPRLSAGGRH